jgi:dihydroneopterin aldolase
MRFWAPLCRNTGLTVPRTARRGAVIQLRGLRVLGTHGVLAEEQSRPQPFEVDLDVDVDLGAAASSDSLADTLDYGGLAESVERVVATERYALLERLAGRILDVVLADPRVVSATVTVRKLRPPVPVMLDHVAVVLTRTR